MEAIIFGCGPAGLAAAAGALDAGATDIRIISKKRKSELFGAQYLHAPIPHFTEEGPVTVRYDLHGTAEGYRDKVYGRSWDGVVSPQALTEEHKAWDIRETYDNMWATFSDSINEIEDITPAIFNALVSDLGPDSIAINSIPRPALCGEGHTFSGQGIWAAGDAPERGIQLQYSCAPNTVICNGIDEVSWYRLSNIFGHKTVEWSMESLRMKPPVSTAAEVIKPTKHNCSCHAGVVHVGRYGKWQKGVLSHEAYADAGMAVERALAGARDVSLPGLGAL